MACYGLYIFLFGNVASLPVYKKKKSKAYVGYFMLTAVSDTELFYYLYSINRVFGEFSDHLCYLKPSDINANYF